MTYQPEPEEEALSQWVNAVIDQEDWSFDVTTLFVGAGGDRPDNDFVTIQITSCRRIAGSDVEYTDTPADRADSYAYKTITHYRGVVQLRVFGLHYRRIAKALEASLEDPAIGEVFDSICLWVQQPVSDLNYVPAAMSTNTQLSAVQDFRFAYAEERTYDQDGVYVIEEVEATGTIDTVTVVAKEP